MQEKLEKYYKSCLETDNLVLKQIHLGTYRLF